MSCTAANTASVATIASVTKPERDLIMISHANPEDDEVAVWLATQLAIDGYQVWCDKAQFLVGEHFWATVDPIIRDHAVKVIFVLSRISNQLTPVRGFNKELDLALQIERQIQKSNLSKQIRFLLPLAVDDLPTSDYNIHFTGRDVLSFRDWAAGFATLRRALQQDSVPRCTTIGASVVAEWWSGYRSVDEGLTTETHTLFSNQFPITAVPEHFYVHNIQYFGDSQHVDVSLDAPVAVYQNGFELYTFAAAEELRNALAPNIVLECRNKPISLAAVLDPAASHEMRAHRPHLVALFRTAWERALEARNDTRFYELANGRHCVYFTKPSDATALSVVVAANDETRGRRFLVRSFGRRRRPTEGDAPQRIRYYHIGIDARPLLHPLCYQVNMHVLFSDDGLTPWESKRRLHRFRRTFCSDWYNDRWRDCLLGFLQQLAGPSKDLAVAVAASQTLRVPCVPLTYEADEYFPRTAIPEPAADEEAEAVEDLLDEFDESTNDRDQFEEDF